MSPLFTHFPHSALLSLKDLIIKEAQINKVKEEQLVETLPRLQIAEDDFQEKSRTLKSLQNDISGDTSDVSLSLLPFLFFPSLSLLPPPFFP